MAVKVGFPWHRLTDLMGAIRPYTTNIQDKRQKNTGNIRSKVALRIDFRRIQRVAPGTHHGLQFGRCAS